MKIIKKCLAYILCVGMMLTPITPSSAAQSDYDYTSVSETLLKIGVLKEINSNLGSMLTRGELARMISPLVGDFSSADYNGMFSDVTSDNRYAKDIYILSAGKIINGYSDGTFRPDNNVSMNEALKIFTVLLGYDSILEAWGGYPTAYIRAAQESKLTKNVSAAGDEHITYGEAVQLLYNTVTADMLKVTGVSENDVILEKRSGISLLTERFDIYQYNGVLEATDITSVTGGKLISGNSILVGTHYFRTAEDADYSEFLGYYVKCYYKSMGSDNEVVLLVKDPVINEELMITAQDIVSVDKPGDIVVTYQTQNGKVKKQKVDAYVDVIYNGKAYPTFNYTDLMIDSGYINLIDNNADSAIDVISVTEFETLVVKSVNKEDKKIYGVYAIDNAGTSGICIDEKEMDRVKLITSSGTKCTIDDIMKDNVISVARSKDNKVILCIVESLGIIGKITAMTTDGADITACVVNDNKYELTDKLTQLIKGGGEQKTNFAVGETLRFAISHDNKIAYSFRTDGTEQYGYLLAAAYGKQPIEPEEGEFLIYSQSGELIQVNGAERIKTNSGSGKSAKETITQWDSVNSAGFTNNGDLVQQLVRYSLNDKGELDKIYYATNAGNEYTFDYKNERFYKKDVTATYFGNATALGEYSLSEENPIFVINKRESDGDVPRDGIDLVPISFFGETSYTFTAYDFDVYKAPKTIVVDASDNSDRNVSSDDAFIVQKQIQVLDDGMIRDKLIGLMNGEVKEYILSEDVAIFDMNGNKNTMTVDDLEEGDACLVSTDVSGNLTQLVLACDLSNDKVLTYRGIRFPKGSSGTYGATKCVVVVGDVADYTVNAIGIRTKDLASDTDKITGHPIVKQSFFYVYDSSTGHVKNATKDDMIAETAPGNGSRVVVVSRYVQIRAVIIIK